MIEYEKNHSQSVNQFVGWAKSEALPTISFPLANVIVGKMPWQSRHNTQRMGRHFAHPTRLRSLFKFVMTFFFQATFLEIFDFLERVYQLIGQ